MRKYLFGSAAITLFFVLMLILEDYLPFRLHGYFPWIILFFFLQSALVMWILYLGKKDLRHFPNYVLGSVAFRFLSAGFVLLIFLASGVENRIALTVQFTTVYLSYLIFEITLVLTNLRPN